MIERSKTVTEYSDYCRALAFRSLLFVIYRCPCPLTHHQKKFVAGPPRISNNYSAAVPNPEPGERTAFVAHIHNIPHPSTLSLQTLRKWRIRTRANDEITNSQTCSEYQPCGLNCFDDSLTPLRTQTIAHAVRDALHAFTETKF